MYQSNYEILAQVVAEKSVIRHVSKHRKPDGSFDLPALVAESHSQLKD